MAKKNIYKTIYKRKYIMMSLLLFFLLLGFGYSYLEAILFVNGNVQLAQFDKSYEKVSIVKIKYYEGDTSSFKIKQMDESSFAYELELNNTPTSYAKVEVTVHNYDTSNWIFDDILDMNLDIGTPTNANIKAELSGIDPGLTVIPVGEDYTFYITFSYIDGNNITNQTLTNEIMCSFTKMVTIHYDGLTNDRGETEEQIRSTSYSSSRYSFTPQVNLGNYEGNITITDSDGNDIPPSDYNLSGGILTLPDLDYNKEYTIHKKATGAETITQLLDGETPDSEGIYTVQPDLTSCTTKLAYDGQPENNLRFIGTNPCNYAKFNCDNNGENCEIWRIIGVMNDVGDAPSFKILKASLDYSGAQWNSTASNDWLTSNMYNTLNGTYLNSLNSKYKDMILETKWNIGGVDNKWTTTNFYEKEHAEKTATAFKIGLFAPSDYGYATSGGDTSTRSTCISAQMNSSGYSNKCRTNNWLYNTTTFQWTMIKRPSSANNQVYYITSAGLSAYTTVTSNTNSYNYAPCVYLKPTIALSGGDGSPENPYTFS